MNSSPATPIAVVGIGASADGLLATGREALDAALKFEPTAVLLDIGLPDVSGDDTPEARQQSLEAGFDHHLPKPVPLAHLEKLLRSGS
jgi:DNA-binding response OmpR family regulator